MKQMTQLPIQSCVITDEFGPFSWTDDSTPESVTNSPARRKRAVYLAAMSGAIRAQRRQEWTDGCSRVLLLWIGFALIVGLGILFR